MPDGAIAARACGLIDTIMHQDLDRLVAAMNALEPPELDPDGRWICTAGYRGLPYQLVLAYPHGRRVTASVERGGCRAVRVGDQTRVQDPDQMIATLLFRLARS